MSSILTKPLPPLFPTRFAPLYRRFGVFGKDIVHYAAIPLSFAFMANLILWIMRLYTSYNHTTITHDGILVILTIFLLLTAYCVGIALGTDEEEAQTRVFMRRLPIQAYRTLIGKLGAGLFLIALFWIVAFCASGIISVQGFSFFESFAILHNSKESSFCSEDQLIILGVTFSLMTTGMTAGLLLGSLSLAGISGILSMMGAGISLGLFLDRSGLHDKELGTVFQCGIWAWNVAMLGIYLWAFDKERPTRLLNITAANMIDYLRYKPSRMKAGFDSPEKRCFRSTFLLFCATSVFLPSLMAWAFMDNKGAFHADVILLWFPALAIAGPFLGVCAWSSDERNSTKWFLYALPISRWQIFRQRIVGLCWRAVALCLCVFAGITTILTINASNLHSLHFEAPPILPAVAIVPAVFVSALIAAFLRLFLRLKMAAVTMTAVLMLFWYMELQTCLGNTVLRREHELPHVIIYSAYCAIALSAILITCTGVAFCRTTLLEQPESRRTALLFVVMAALVVWGGFVIAASPLDIFRTIFP